MNDLLFIRHPETDMAGTFCGHIDPRLNAAGHRQIRILIEGLHAEPITYVVSSDLQRASTAAKAIADFFAVPCLLRRELREIGFGEWEGRTWDQIESLDANFARQWLEHFPSLTPPGGEPFNDFETRVLGEINLLMQPSESGLIAVVTHAGVMRVVLQNLCGFDATAAGALTKQYCSSFRCTRKAHEDPTPAGASRMTHKGRTSTWPLDLVAIASPPLSTISGEQL